jgi:uncharacterized membrane protein
VIASKASGAFFYGFSMSKPSSPFEITGFILKNFATPIVFYLAFETLGPKPAIGFAVGMAGLQVLTHLFFRWKFSLFFVLATVFTVAFGSMDLFISTPRYFRLEGVAQNFCVGCLFLGTLYSKKPLILRLALALPEKFRPEGLDEGYLRKLTLLWAGYFYIKALVVLILAFRVNLGVLYIVRVTFGNLSALVLFFGEYLYRKYWKRRTS